MSNNGEAKLDIRVIANYFGKPLPYLQLWLDSCGYNQEITWIFFTDIDMSVFDVPHNIKVVRTSFEAIKARFQKTFPYPIRYEKAWDFCAFRPTFGTVFADELGAAEYWGWCDCDLIFGNLSICVDACKNGFDKVMPKGHFSLIKNDSSLNTFVLEHPLTRKAVALNETGLPCFDEEAFSSEILPEFRAKQFNSIPFVNTACRYGNYLLDDTLELFRVLEIDQSVKRGFPFVATWSDGKMCAYFAMPNKSVRKIEIAYFHFFRRELIPNICHLVLGKTYLIRPNEIVEYDGHDLSWPEIKRMDKFRMHWKYFMQRLNWQTVSAKIRNYIG